MKIARRFLLTHLIYEYIIEMKKVSIKGDENE